MPTSEHWISFILDLDPSLTAEPQGRDATAFTLAV